MSWSQRYENSYLWDCPEKQLRLWVSLHCSNFLVLAIIMFGARKGPWQIIIIWWVMERLIQCVVRRVMWQAIWQTGNDQVIQNTINLARKSHIDFNSCCSTLWNLNTGLWVLAWAMSIGLGSRCCGSRCFPGWFGSKERPRNGIFCVLPTWKMRLGPKKERGGGEGEGNRGLTASVSFLPLPLPLFPFLALIPFFMCKTPKIPFLAP